MADEKNEETSQETCLPSVTGTEMQRRGDKVKLQQNWTGTCVLSNSFHVLTHTLFQFQSERVVNVLLKELEAKPQTHVRPGAK